ncbi:hypothetical protein [Hymenobacter algoricola]|uniref:Uncharacterized protein n=1 Tax=Hymenobacter algoricola TaxID=486267 RepID=A0ABP7NAE6_9BACT
MLDLVRPEVFDDGHPENVLVLLRRSFAHLCAILSEHGVPQPGQLSLFEFHAYFEYLEQKQQPENRG